MKYITTVTDGLKRELKGYYDNSTQTYILVDKEGNKTEKEGKYINPYIVFDPFSELKAIHSLQNI